MKISKLDTCVEQIRLILTILLVVLIVLKIAGLINISWIAVTAPWWVPVIIALTLGLLAKLLD